MNRVDANVLFRQRGREITHQTDDAVFGGVIAGKPVVSHAERRAHTAQPGG